MQSGHALAKFCIENPISANDWHTKSQFLIYLSLKDETALSKFIFKLDRHNVCYSIFREPDLNNSITAIALEPSDVTKKLVQKFPLALNNQK